MTTATAAAQGPVYRERWGYLHLESRRAEVFDALHARSVEDVNKVSELLVAADAGVPFHPVANALAYLRGVAADDAFRLRTALGIYVLPEVVDPDASLEACRTANFSVFLPFAMKAPGAMTFELIVRDAKGEQVWTQTIERDVAMEDVRMARSTISVTGVELLDGAYEVEMRALLDGKQPRQYDPSLRWTFHVLRGYQQRAETAMAASMALRDELPLLHRAQLDGLSAQVSRAYTGEAFAVVSDAVRELERLEAGLDNLAEQRVPLHGMKGSVATALPAGEILATDGVSRQQIVQPCVLRLPNDDQPHPLVVFASGSPAYDIGSRRPTAPVMREASWLLRELDSFAVTEQWHLACFDSPGGARPYAQALLSAIEALPQVLPTGGTKPLLVCDREAASVVGMQLSRFQPHISGVVFVGSGAMPKGVLAQLGDLPVRYIALFGYPASQAADRTLQFLRVQREAGKSTPDVLMLHERQEPWPFGVARSLTELRAFAVQVFGER